MATVVARGWDEPWRRLLRVPWWQWHAIPTVEFDGGGGSGLGRPAGRPAASAARLEKRSAELGALGVGVGGGLLVAGLVFVRPWTLGDVAPTRHSGGLPPAYVMLSAPTEEYFQNPRISGFQSSMLVLIPA